MCKRAVTRAVFAFDEKTVGAGRDGAARGGAGNGGQVPGEFVIVAVARHG
jgi:hypothetical protein